MENVTRLGNSPFNIFDSVMDHAERSGFPTVAVTVGCVAVGSFVVLLGLLCLRFCRDPCLLRFARHPGGLDPIEMQNVGPQVGPIIVLDAAAATTWV